MVINKLLLSFFILIIFLLSSFWPYTSSWSFWGPNLIFSFWLSWLFIKKREMIFWAVMTGFLLDLQSSLPLGSNILALTLLAVLVKTIFAHISGISRFLYQVLFFVSINFLYVFLIFILILIFMRPSQLDIKDFLSLFWRSFPANLLIFLFSRKLFIRLPLFYTPE